MTKGFSLVELLIALVLVQIVVLGSAAHIRLAMESLDAADAGERLLTRAESLVDSLAAVPAVTPDSVIGTRWAIRWDTLQGAVVLSGRARRLSLPPVRVPRP